MKTGGSMCGGYMREKYLDCYADYIIKFINSYAEHGIKISAITPQNETNTQQNGQMPACIWHPETEARFINILKSKFINNGLDVKIWMFDHNFNDTQRVLWSLNNCEGLKTSCDGAAFHYYAGAIEQTASVKTAHPGLELHLTEGGPRLTDNYGADWCKWGLMISKAIKVGYSSFTGWNLMLNELGAPNIGPFIGICGGFVTLDNRNGELSFSGQYKAYSHIAPYVNKKSKLHYVSVNESFDLNISKYPKSDKKIEGILIDNENGEKTAVLVNPNDHGYQAQIEIYGALWYVELQADSISTVIIKE
jgi:glucosylceramidase